MNATVTPVPSKSPVSQKAPADGACPVAMLTLFASAVLWLLAASLLGLRNSLNFHNPALLAGHGYLSYGRVHAAENASLLYGFGVQSALGLGLWLLCRLGRTSLIGPPIVFIGAVFWNIAVTLGVAGVLLGGGTGYQSFELPVWCAPMLFLAFLMIGLCALLTFHQREPGPLYPSQWFVVGSLFWFPWIFSTAALLLLYVPERGVLQVSTACWYAQNLDAVFLGFAGLASAFYFIPKLIGRPLHSYYQASMGFWTLALFGSWGGLSAGAPLPSWITSLSVVGAVLTAVPILTIATNMYQTVCRDVNSLDADPTLRFTYVGLIFWVIAGAQQIVGALPTVSAITDLTWFGAAQKELFHYGFYALTVFGALYYIVPRVLGLERGVWSAKLLSWHFWLTFIGVLISYVALLVAGVGQGILLANTGNSFVDVMRRTIHPIRFIAIGDLLVIVGTVLFLLNLGGVLCAAYRQCCGERKERA